MALEIRASDIRDEDETETITLTELQKKIFEALDTNASVNWEFAEISPSEEFKELKKYFKKLFKSYNGN